ncbi:efflux RND transporter periplasmic adaptor subunit [Vibrio sonorensis]|uniref:efflux RND transporter periplasmic adaptor subunit n=1 Tax=Vibrio sonorensis TaxID=1004316 RepID=UPI0008D9E8E6|nr:HlyD family secretion protein [Vibrio sonorensis]
MIKNKKWLFIPALACGVIVLFWAVNSKSDLPTNPAKDNARVVKTMMLEPVMMAPLAIGYGKASPKVEWQAISEVTGKLVYRHPRLEKGQLLPSGTKILQIDPLDYELKLAQAKADLNSSETSLAKLDQQQTNLEQTLNIEVRRLAIADKEYKRKQNLRKKGLTSESDVETQLQSVLTQKKLVQEIRNQIALLPDEKQVAKAKVKINEAKVAEALRALDKTTLYLPQEMRIAEVNVELDQVVNMQQSLVTAHELTVMEVEAQLSIHDMQILASSFEQFALDESGAPRADMTFSPAKVLLNSGSITNEWMAKVARISETVDPAQATAGVILEVTQDVRRLNPNSGPPLVKGMFVTAEIQGFENLSWVIPQGALHGNRIYLMGEDNRLEIQEVAVRYRRDNQVVVEGDLHKGQRLILHDLLPAIPGMLLREEKSKEHRE